MKNVPTLTASALALALGFGAASAWAEESRTSPLLLAAGESTMDEAGDAVSDTWITTKVKSALLVDDATPGMDIKVETKDGVVSLSGTVASEAEREMAISKAREVKGVREVMADGLEAVD
ncbi:MAG TPA: BON domain-containing protein [Pseudomonas sp.]|jgi:hyperosmotically inducible protein|nr:BON domain-containing protein [Pseudomonas sp.]